MTMKLTLKNIRYHNKNNPMDVLSFMVEYGYNQTIYYDTVTINFNSQKKTVYITFKVENPGIAIFAEHIIGVLTHNHHFESVSHIIEYLSERIELINEIQN